MDDPVTVSWAEHVFADRDPDARLFPGSFKLLDYLFVVVLTALEILNIGFSKGSLRAGGAAYFYRSGKPVDWIRFRGRWKSQDTLEHYVQVGTSLLLNARFCPQARALLEASRRIFPYAPLPPT